MPPPTIAKPTEEHPASKSPRVHEYTQPTANPNPFAAAKPIEPGSGDLEITVLPPANPVLSKFSYQYPLKLIAPDPLVVNHTTVHTVFLLTYGGGLVAGDAIDLHISLVSSARLVLLTQGSTKIFKAEDDTTLTIQHMTARVAPGAGLCFLPDPVQPFAGSAFAQTQRYELESLDTNICVLDWVCEGRLARGESWDFRQYSSKNEVWLNQGTERLLVLRDNLLLDRRGEAPDDLRKKMHGLGVYGTLILGGQLFKTLGNYLMEEFRKLPRIGAKQWDDVDTTESRDPSEAARTARLEQERADAVLWTAAVSRGYVVVKFGAKNAEAGKRWLLSMLQPEGTVAREFGERALMCLR